MFFFIFFFSSEPLWDVSTNHRVASQAGPKINDKHDKDKLEYMEVSMRGEGGASGVKGVHSKYPRAKWIDIHFDLFPVVQFL